MDGGRRWLVMGVAVALLFGCGGGDGDGIRSVGSFASGPVSGFGSVIVNGVRFDDTGAGIKNEDGLRLGMTVEVEGDKIVQGVGTARPTSNASLIRYASELRGRVEAIDLEAGIVTVLGQDVAIDTRTVFDDSLVGGLALLSEGDVIEVYGQFDPAAARYVATRIEPASASDGYQLRGIVSRLDQGAKRFRVGSESFSYSGAASVPADLANGSFVRLRLQTIRDSASRWVVTSFKAGANPLPDTDEAKIEGLITAYTSPNSFRVNGQPVDASNAEFKDGKAGVVLGARVQVEGSVRGGVLRAEEVQFESEDEQQAKRLEFEGKITEVNSFAPNFTLRAGSRSFTIVTLRKGLRFEAGTAADLKVGAEVEVKALLSSDGASIEATRIKFGD
jgi:Domain of unknown function (DUF5666)